LEACRCITLQVAQKSADVAEASFGIPRIRFMCEETDFLGLPFAELCKFATKTVMIHHAKNPHVAVSSVFVDCDVEVRGD
jgi:hypothetical protein